MKQNGVVCWPRPALLFFIVRFEYLISGPKSYREFRETGPRKRLNYFQNSVIPASIPAPVNFKTTQSFIEV